MVKHTTLIERGKRLQSLRKKAGLTRLAFAEQTGMSANTLKALELGDRELTAQKALLFSNLFSSLFSVSLGEDAHEASFDYLFYGKKKESDSNKEVPTPDQDTSLIQKEINLFKSNSSYLTLTISDDLMSPYYNENDFVAGWKVINKNQYQMYQGQVCIIESSDGKRLLRRIIKIDNRKITTCIINTNVNPNINIVQEYEVRAIAQATRHWHLSELVRTPHDLAQPSLNSSNKIL
ncbi:MAG: helix-turn-helix domain-containing protein [Alphaproteobacteria bacterium]|jgi:transcriptional regulator with XRE-family HTH domain|nr:helix-turn-helix domain-containing protein [Alphaproteobacteria bacterium]